MKKRDRASLRCIHWNSPMLETFLIFTAFSYWLPLGCFEAASLWLLNYKPKRVSGFIFMSAALKFASQEVNLACWSRRWRTWLFQAKTEIKGLTDCSSIYWQILYPSTPFSCLPNSTWNWKWNYSSSGTKLFWMELYNIHLKRCTQVQGVPCRMMTDWWFIIKLSSCMIQQLVWSHWQPFCET